MITGTDPGARLFATEGPRDDIRLAARQNQGGHTQLGRPAGRRELGIHPPRPHAGLAAAQTAQIKGSHVFHAGQHARTGVLVGIA